MKRVSLRPRKAFFSQCAIPENIHTSPTEDPPPLLKFQLSVIHFFKIFWPYRTSHLPGNSTPFCGGAWKFSGTVQYL